ncbi:MAG: DNA-3-methyladenine glycosylase [Lachnospiraceae bacterium]|nr:DNA-3-methyladenine glycosylase [Lachnospiraceae bacterium]
MWKKQLEEYQSCIGVSPRLPRAFFTRDGITVAKALLGKVLVHETAEGTIRGIITEVESYMGINDKGSHTYGGRRTERTEPMFHIGGTSYVYFTYGMYYCMNITSDLAENPQAVLIRSVIAADEASKELMLKLRMGALIEKAKKRKASKGECLDDTEYKRMKKNTLKHLADGPGKMCIAMNITKADNDIDMVDSPSFYVTEGIYIASEEIKAGKRIGIDYAQEAADYLWRFYID